MTPDEVIRQELALPRSAWLHERTVGAAVQADRDEGAIERRRALRAGELSVCRLPGGCVYPACLSGRDCDPPTEEERRELR